MPRAIQEPTVTDDGQDRQEISHPAFAQISAGRVSGGAVLYGSDFQHQHYIRIRISPSTLMRSLSNDWAHASLQRYIEVDLSEAQWAQFVSSMNTGGGTQCTLSDLNGEMVPGIPAPTKRRDQFKSEAVAACREAFAAIDELQAALEDAKLSQKARDDLNKRAESIRSRLTGSLPFVLDQFAEHMETTVEHAKVEINAFALREVTRLGIEQLAGEASLKLTGD